LGSYVGVALQLHYIFWSATMKTATLPTVRVLPEVREQAEGLLEKGESLSMFIEDSLRRNIAMRLAEREFLTRGMAAGVRARETGVTVSADESLARLRALAAKHTASNNA
jgi:predicted transcriptional regulator